MRHITSFALVALLPFQAAMQSSPEDPMRRCFVDSDAPASLTGDWTLTWDDTTDLELTSRDKACRVELTDLHGTLVGRFDGPVLGRERSAVFTGETLPGTQTPLVTLVQREQDYSCAYLLTRESDERLVGTWRDSRGGGGTVELTRARSIEDGSDVIVTFGGR